VQRHPVRVRRVTPFSSPPGVITPDPPYAPGCFPSFLRFAPRHRACLLSARSFVGTLFSEREPNVLRRVITRYVSRHPRASDTLAGIAEWWLPKGTKATPRELDSALDELVADGILQCTTLPGGTKLYSARRNKR
jgi:hypothetical protein